MLGSARLAVDILLMKLNAATIAALARPADVGDGQPPKHLRCPAAWATKIPCVAHRDETDEERECEVPSKYVTKRWTVGIKKQMYENNYAEYDQ